MYRVGLLACFNVFKIRETFVSVLQLPGGSVLNISLGMKHVCVAAISNVFLFYGGELLAPRSNPKLEGHPLLAVLDCLFNIFAATLHIWRPSPPSAT
jgi:hypothetical protein